MQSQSEPLCRFLDASKYCPHAEAVVTPVNNQYISSSDSPAVSTAADSQPSSSSSCLIEAVPFQQSGPTMESSAAACVLQGNHAPLNQQPVAQNMEAVSSFSTGGSSENTDDSQMQKPSRQPPGALQRPTEAQEQPAANPDIQKLVGDSRQSDKQPHRSQTPAEMPASPPKTNGTLHPHGKQENHKLHLSEPAAAPTPDLPLPGLSTSTHPLSSVAMPALHHSIPERQPSAAPPVSTSSQQAVETTQTSSLPSGAYMIPYTATTLSASPQTSPVQAPPMQALSGTQPGMSQQPQQLPQQLPHQQPQQQLPHQQPQQQLPHQQPQQQLQQQLQQQQQLVQQRRYQMLLQQQAQLHQLNMQRPQAPHATLGRPPLQLPYTLQQQQQQQHSRLSTPVMQPRATQPVWPVPLPRSASGKCSQCVS